MLKTIIEKATFYKNEIGAFGIIFLLYLFFYIAGIGCPIKFITGISCLGCGMTRAWLCLLKMDIKQAFYYHPGFIIPLIAIVIFCAKEKIGKRRYNIAVGTLILSFIAIYFYRLFGGYNDIVVFEIKKGFIYRRIYSILLTLQQMNDSLGK